jgi:hypothetical protein
MRRCYLVIQELAARVVEQGQPAPEELGLHPFQPQMHRNWVALVASAGQHHRRPEVMHRREVRSPIAGDGPLENWSKLRVGTHLDVKAVDQMPDHILGEPGNLGSPLR